VAGNITISEGDLAVDIFALPYNTNIGFIGDSITE
jgi:hypothetical protein